jgi:hypothetical protein
MWRYNSVTLFEKKSFTMHSGGSSEFKIECDSLTDDDLETLAYLIAQKYNFKLVKGVPTGGTALAKKLSKYSDMGASTFLIVDDVLTTGKSMEAMRYALSDRFKDIKGVVVFARGKCPDWVEPVFQMWEMN